MKASHKIASCVWSSLALNVGVACVLVLGVALAACSGGSAGTDSTTPSPSTAPQAIRTSYDVRYLPQRDDYVPALLDVYAPGQPGGPWPVVVMLHGAGGTKTDLDYWATQVAGRGAVVYVPDWGPLVMQSAFGPEFFSAEQLRDFFARNFADIAAVIRFARATAAQYGGDPADVTLFGHSAGANEAAHEAFSGGAASAGGLEGNGSPTPDALVLFDPDLALGDTAAWDAYLAEDKGLMQLATPWQYVDSKVRFPIVVLGSGDPWKVFRVRDTWDKASWLAARDPDGRLHRGLQRMGVLDGREVNNVAVLRLLVQRLRAAGTTATYIQFEDSTHSELGPADMRTFLDVLVPGSTR